MADVSATSHGQDASGTECSTGLTGWNTKPPMAVPVAAGTPMVPSPQNGTGVSVALVNPGPVDTEFFARRGRAYGNRRPRPVDPDSPYGL